MDADDQDVEDLWSPSFEANVLPRIQNWHGHRENSLLAESAKQPALEARVQLHVPAVPVLARAEDVPPVAPPPAPAVMSKCPHGFEKLGERRLIDEFTFEKELSRNGNKRVVSRVRSKKDTRKCFVLKQFVKGEGAPGSHSRKDEQECRQANGRVRLVDCKHVVKPEYMYEDDGYLYLLSPYYPGFDCFDFTNKFEQSFTRTLNIVHDVLKALEAVHAVGLLHRDIKLDNVLVDTSAGKGREVARLIDFDQAATSVHYVPGMTNVKARYANLRVVGTHGYVPPEAFLPGVPYEPASDVYQVGMLFYELAHYSNKVSTAIQRGTRSVNDDEAHAFTLDQLAAVNWSMWPGCSGSRDLCRVMLRSEPSARPSVAEALRRLTGLLATRRTK
jgi:serine/threonine protein kinase